MTLDTSILSIQAVSIICGIAAFFIQRRKDKNEQIILQQNMLNRLEHLQEQQNANAEIMKSFNQRLSNAELVIELMANQHKANHKQDLGGVL